MRVEGDSLYTRSFTRRISVRFPPPFVPSIGGTRRRCVSIHCPICLCCLIGVSVSLWDMQTAFAQIPVRSPATIFATWCIRRLHGKSHSRVQTNKQMQLLFTLRVCLLPPFANAFAAFQTDQGFRKKNFLCTLATLSLDRRLKMEFA